MKWNKIIYQWVGVGWSPDKLILFFQLKKNANCTLFQLSRPLFGSGGLRKCTVVVGICTYFQDLVLIIQGEEISNCASLV